MNNEFLKWFEAEESLKDTIYSSTSSKINVIQATGRISRASLEESTQRALAIHQDVKIPDESIVIDKDLLQEIRNLLNNRADEYAECKALRDKLDSLYPYLNKK